jgi:hypothetical protein
MDYKEVFELAENKGYKNNPFHFTYHQEGLHDYTELCLIQKWLREEHKILLTVEFTYGDGE